jgi:hypothetical protein
MSKRRCNTQNVLIDFDDYTMSNEAYIQSLRANMLGLILGAENARACCAPGSMNQKLYDAFAEIGLDVLFPSKDNP